MVVEDQYQMQKTVHLEVYLALDAATDCVAFGALLRTQDRDLDADIAREWHPKSQVRPTAEHELLLTIPAGTASRHSAMPSSRLCELKAQNIHATYAKSTQDFN